MIRVFIADDHEIVRVGLRELFALHADIKVVGEAADGPTVLAAHRAGEWDVLLLDLTLPKVSGFSVLRQLRETDPQLIIVVLSMYPEDQYAPRLLRDGASCYLSKDRTGAEIVAAVRKAVAAGPTTPTSPEPPEASGVAPAPLHDRLLPRELQVFLLLAQGQTVDRISSELKLTPSTVEVLIGRIQTQLGVTSLSGVVRYAREAGLAG